MKKSQLAITVISIFVVVTIISILVITKLSSNSKDDDTSNDEDIVVTSTPAITQIPSSSDIKTEAQLLLSKIKNIYTQESSENITDVATFDNLYFEKLSLPGTFLKLELSNSEAIFIEKDKYKVYLELEGCDENLFFEIISIGGNYKINSVDELSKVICADQAGITPTAKISPTPSSTIKTTPLPSDEVELNCLDCSLAPVDKKYKLRSDYTPIVVPVDLPGGGYVTDSTKSALIEMFNKASEEGIDIAITSSYRSYAMQEETFEYWVSTEIAKGKSRKDAEIEANTYSAKPGHSEHQLGTVVDVRCLTCSAFVENEDNEKVYKFIEENAHKYGFVISYPPDSQHATGYIYEPWHIRYIGEELATEIFNKNYITSKGTIYLAKFLEAKKMY